MAFTLMTDDVQYARLLREFVEDEPGHQACEDRLRAFAAELAALCAKFNARIYGGARGSACGDVGGDRFYDMEVEPGVVTLVSARVGLLASPEAADATPHADLREAARAKWRKGEIP